MEDIGVGGGIAILAFWIFIALIVLGGIWDNIRKRDVQHETVRRVIESGQEIDQQLIDKLLAASDGNATRLDVALRVSALWILPVAAGLIPFAFVLGTISEDAKVPLLGISAMLFCFGVGFLIAAKVAERWYPIDDGSATTPFKD